LAVRKAMLEAPFAEGALPTMYNSAISYTWDHEDDDGEPIAHEFVINALYSKPEHGVDGHIEEWKAELISDDPRGKIVEVDFQEYLNSHPDEMARIEILLCADYEEHYGSPEGEDDDSGKE
jgi:hypothetical protein